MGAKRDWSLKAKKRFSAIAVPLCPEKSRVLVRQVRAIQAAPNRLALMVLRSSCKNLGRWAVVTAYFDSSRIVSSSPLSDKGYMRLLMSCWMMLMLWRYCHTPWGSGFIHANLGKACVSR